MLKLYIPQCEGKAVIDPIKSALGIAAKDINLFGEPDIWEGFTLPVEVVSNPAWCDYICVPHTWAAILHQHDYIAHIAQVAREHSKRVIVFVIGDTNEYVFFPAGVSTIVIRSSQYKDRLLPYEIMMPAYAQDLQKIMPQYVGIQDSVEFTPQPTVSFCGWAQASNIRSKLSFFIKDVTWAMIGQFIKRFEARRPGITLRKIGIVILKKSQKITSNIIVRSSYTGSVKTVQGKPDELRAEYIHNMASSVYAFAPRGDGNFSVRFFEALSLGRIPVILDTQIALPLENLIQYDDFVVRVPLENLDRLDIEIADWHNRQGETGIREACKKARKAFDQYLNVRVFCTYVFTREFLEQIPRNN